jgi:hypothetical protein
MATLKSRAVRSPATTPRAARVAPLIAALLGTLIGSPSPTLAYVDSPVLPDTIDAGHAPWLPDVILAADPYIIDPGYFEGGLFATTWAVPRPVGADFIGSANAVLSNGDVVVAGLVPAWGAANPANGLFNLGLWRVKWTTTQTHWPNAGAYGFGNLAGIEPFIVYPNSNAPNYQTVRDVKVANGWIYILVDTPNVGQAGGGRQNVSVIQLREDGSSISVAGVFGFAPVGGVDSEDFYGAQLVPIGNDRMIVTATGYDATGAYVAVSRLIVLGNGAVTPDSAWGSGYGGASSLNRIRRYFAPVAFCQAASQCQATAAYAVTPIGEASIDVYISGSRRWQGNDWDPYVLKISSDTGLAKPEFDGDGWRAVPFDQPDSNYTDYGAGVYVHQNEVFLAAQVDRGCHGGIGISRLVGNTGALAPTFGTGGKVVYGGVAAADPGCSSFPNAHVPFAMSTTGGRVGVVGYNRWSDQGGNINTDPMLGVVDALTGEVLSLRRYPSPSGGDAVFYGVTGGPEVTSPFIVSGNVRVPSAKNSLAYQIARLVPQSFDRIFMSNMGGSP